MCTLEETQYLTKELAHKIRTRQSYEENLDVVAKSEKVVYKETFGVERYCKLNDLKFFHPFENISGDIMHDLCESVRSL